MRIKTPVHNDQQQMVASAPPMPQPQPLYPSQPQDQVQNQQEEGVIYKFVNNVSAAQQQHYNLSHYAHQQAYANPFLYPNLQTLHQPQQYFSHPPTVYNIDFNNYNNSTSLYPSTTLPSADFEQEPPLAPQKKKEEEITAANSSHTTNGATLIAVAKDNGNKKQELPAFVIHELQNDDTLFSLALSYGVSVEDIKLRNGILNDDLAFYDKREVVIPYPSLLPPKRIKFIDVKEEEKKRECAVRTFTFLKQCTEDEARYYLLLHEYNWCDALAEYESDLKWHREQDAIKESKRLARQKRREATERRKGHFIVRKLKQIGKETFGLCFPGLLITNHDMVLDDEDDEEEALEMDRVVAT